MAGGPQAAWKQTHPSGLAVPAFGQVPVQDGLRWRWAGVVVLLLMG